MHVNVRRIRVAVVAAILLLVACSSGKGSEAQSDTNQQPAQKNNPGQQQNTDQQTDQGTTGAVAKAKLVSAETCHTEKLAGGNSDALFDIEIDVPDGTKVKVIFESDQQGILVGDGVVKGKSLLVRIPVVDFGEKITVKTMQVGDAQTAENVVGFPDPAHTVPDESGSECNLVDAETEQNGTINQPNAGNKAGQAN